MTRHVKWTVGTLLAGLLALAAWPTCVWLKSEAVIGQRYTLPRSLVQADANPAALARGARVVRLAGCTGCHGPDLRGRSLRDAEIPIVASNLRALTASETDEAFDLAIRRGLRTDASSLWIMPSQSYVYMHDSDVAAILGYLRTLSPSGNPTPPPEFGFDARSKIAEGEVQPVASIAMTQMPAVTLGPHYDGGRYLAMIACGSCHGADLSGTDHAPDLNVTTRYTREAFFQLLRRGSNAHGKWLPTMGPLARQRFHILADWEIDPLYAYLVARARAPTQDQLSGSIR